jgi:hypothetical protein
MKSRIVWFVAGSATGVYTAVKARRAAYRLSTPGIVDQAGALGLGWRTFTSELRDGMQSREHEIARRLIADHETPLRLDEAHPDHTPSVDVTSPTTPPDKKAT